jgi:hypothetical protein
MFDALMKVIEAGFRSGTDGRRGCRQRESEEPRSPFPNLAFASFRGVGRHLRVRRACGGKAFRNRGFLQRPREDLCSRGEHRVGCGRRRSCDDERHQHGLPARHGIGGALVVGSRAVRPPAECRYGWTEDAFRGSQIQFRPLRSRRCRSWLRRRSELSEALCPRAARACRVQERVVAIVMTAAIRRDPCRPMHSAAQPMIAPERPRLRVDSSATGAKDSPNIGVHDLQRIDPKSSAEIRRAAPCRPENSTKIGLR